MSHLDKPSQVRFIRRQVFAQTAGTRFIFFFCLIIGIIPMSMSWYFGFNAISYPEMAKAFGKTQNLYFLIAAVFLLGALFAGLYLAYQMYKEYKILQFIFDNGKEKFFKVEKIHLENISAKYTQRTFEIRSELGELIVLKIPNYDLMLFDLGLYLSNQQGEFLAYHSEKYPQRIFPINFIKNLK
jgi:hypothetical protein